MSLVVEIRVKAALPDIASGSLRRRKSGSPPEAINPFIPSLSSDPRYSSQADSILARTFDLRPDRRSDSGLCPGSGLLRS
jgi:hypothetical protein